MSRWRCGACNTIIDNVCHQEEECPKCGIYQPDFVFPALPIETTEALWKEQNMSSRIRVYEPSELLEKMTAHCGECKHCKGIVKMMRDTETCELRPDQCICLLCGQRYHMKIEENIWEWEKRQWEEKEKQKNYCQEECCKPLEEKITVAGWQNIPEELLWLKLKGDKRHWNGKYINSSEDEITAEMSKTMYDTDGQFLGEIITNEDATSLVREGAYLIACGFVL